VPQKGLKSGKGHSRNDRNGGRESGRTSFGERECGGRECGAHGVVEKFVCSCKFYNMCEEIANIKSAAGRNT